MDQSAFDEIVNFAKEKEKEAGVFYRDLASKAEAAGIKQLLEEIAAEEDKHYEILDTMTLDAFKDAEPAPAIEDIKLAKTMPELEAKPDMNFQDILTVAIKREEKAEQLYKHMAAMAGQDEQKQLLERLAAEELGHRNRLEKEYEDKVLQEN